MSRILLMAAAPAVLCLAPAPARAAELDELVVTATRLPSRPDQVTGARVIGPVELQARQAVFATDVLATVPGVGVHRNGAFGGVGSIRIRGASADKTLVLVDGIAVGDPADPSGAFDAGLLQLADVARIEVLSGPQGSLWGSEAIGGVVAITTREVHGLRLEAEAGSLSTARVLAAAGRAGPDHALSATLTALRTDGVSKAAAGREADGLESVALGLTGRARIAPGLQVEGRLRRAVSEAEIDGYPAPAFQLDDTRERQAAETWSGQAAAAFEAVGFSHRLSLGGYQLERESRGGFPARFEARRQVLRWTLERDGLAAGAEREETQADLSGRAAADLVNTAAFLVARAAPAAWLDVTGSVRWDWPEGYDSRASGRLSAAADLGRGLSLTASAGQGFKTPTLSQRVCDFCFAPPVPLRAERAWGQDLRLGWRSADGARAVALTAFRLRVRDQIAYQGLRYVNLARTRTEGLEAEAQLTLAPGVRLRLAYAVLDAVDGAGLSLLRVPDHSGSAVLTLDRGAWSGAMTVRGETSQTDTARDGFTRVVRPAFATADLALAYALSPRVSLTARVENLADARFQETFGYGEPGRSAFLGLRLRG